MENVHTNLYRQICDDSYIILPLKYYKKKKKTKKRE